MTIPLEEMEALEWAEKFLIDLLYPKKTPKVPLHIRKMASRILRHYPGPTAIKWLYEKNGKGGMWK